MFRVRGLEPRSLRAWSRMLVAAFALEAALGACRYAPTEVLVTLDSDAPADRTLRIRSTVRRGAATDGGGAVNTWSRGDLDGGVTLPTSFAIVPADGDPRDGTVTVIIEGEVGPGPAGEPPLSLRRIARFAFTPRVPTSLPVFLSVACGAHATDCTSVALDACTVGVRCEEAGLTCGNEGQCVPTDVMPMPITDAAPVDVHRPPDVVDSGPVCPVPAANDYCNSIPSLAAAPVIDGELDCAMPLQHIDPVLWTGPGTPPLSTSFAIAWHPRGIYLFVRVDAATWSPAQPSDELFCGDGVELDLDHDALFANAPLYDLSDTRDFIVAAPVGTEDHRGASYYRGQSDPRTAVTRFGSFARAGGYVVEESIEAADFPIANWAPQAGEPIAFDLQINVGGGGTDAAADASDASTDASAGDGAVSDAGDAGTAPVCTARLGQFLLHAGPPGCARPEHEVCGFCQPTLLAR